MRNSERAKRDKWVIEKTREIKQLTARGLEPKIQDILDKHRIECRQLEKSYKVILL